MRQTLWVVVWCETPLESVFSSPHLSPCHMYSSCHAGVTPPSTESWSLSVKLLLLTAKQLGQQMLRDECRGVLVRLVYV